MQGFGFRIYFSLVRNPGARVRRIARNGRRRGGRCGGGGGAACWMRLWCPAGHYSLQFPGVTAERAEQGGSVGWCNSATSLCALYHAPASRALLGAPTSRLLGTSLPMRASSTRDDALSPMSRWSRHPSDPFGFAIAHLPYAPRTMGGAALLHSHHQSLSSSFARPRHRGRRAG